MTFRSFSRFVRWYRWPILCFLAGLGGFVLFGVGVGADNPVAQAVGAGAAIFSVIPGVGTAVAASDRLRPVLDRYYRRRRRADEREKARLRAMPLRGWTK